MATLDPPLDLQRLKDVVAEIGTRMGDVEDRGTPSQGLPELAGADTGRFGIAVHTRDGDVVVAGEADSGFSIQSISKVFALTLALERFHDDVWKRVGREPSGDPYNSIVDLERLKGFPRNPFINPGAIVVADMLLDSGSHAETVVQQIARLAEDPSIGEDETIVTSELSGSHLNNALASLAKHFGNIHHDIPKVMEAYVRQCAVELSCRQLAAAGRYLMEGHVGGDAGSRNAARRIRRINSLMLTCGQYDGSGEFAFRVGLPAKSGVGGGILAVAPNRASIAVWSPGLDDSGNSAVGTLALEMLSERMGWSVFADGGEA